VVQQHQEITMIAAHPEDICRLFRLFMAHGDLEAVLRLYDDEAVFLNQSREPRTMREDLRSELAPFAAARTRFDYDIRQITETGGIALMHTLWTLTAPSPMKVYAIEVARRQEDGGWRWLIGDPYTVGWEFPGRASAGPDEQVLVE
jgi:ketosteroid isomerase-like protein